jgi:hypothetical protein
MNAVSRTYTSQLTETYEVKDNGSWRGQFRRSTGEIDEFCIEAAASAAEKGFPNLNLGRGTVRLDVKQNNSFNPETFITDYWLEMKGENYFATWKEVIA